VAYYEQSRFKAIPNDAPTLATHLADHGYTTIATITNPQLSAERNFDRGFDRFENLRLETTGMNNHSRNVEDGGGPIESVFDSIRTYYSHNRLLARLRERKSILNPFAVAYVFKQLSRYYDDWPPVRAENVLGRFVERLDTAAEDGPFFAWTHLMDLHAPLHPSSITGGGLGATDAFRYSLGSAAWTGDRRSATYERMYDRSLRYVDQQIGRLVRWLRREGMWDETILVLTADHGEAMGERGVNGHRNHYPYDELLHVPLLVRVPGGPGRRTDVPFSLAWLHELLAEVLDVPPAPLPSRSPSGSHTDEPDDGRVVLTDAIGPFGHTVIARDDRFKLVRHFDGSVPSDQDERYRLMKNLGVRTTAFGPEVFDGLNVAYHRPTDPCERTPLPRSAAPAALGRAADDLRTELGSLPRVDGRIDAETSELLEDLGYA
jgi:choline-sulfatase